MILRGGVADGARTGLVLVHGRGSSAGDILGLGDVLSLPDLAIAAPEAPGRSWWPTSFLAPQAQMEPHVLAGLEAVEAAITTLADDGIPRERIAVGGFSQGACLALEYAARRGDVMAVFGLSGGLVGTHDDGAEPEPDLYGHADKGFDYGTDLTGTSALITVHEEDPHIPLARVRRSAAVLRGLGADVTEQVYPGAGHSVLPDGHAVIRRVLGS